jgi:pantoate--beta-alanine ligase
MTDILHTIAEVRATVASARADGRTVALVPTMGALHSGHLSLVERAATLGDLVIVSIFVNPLQFAAGEDLERYPRTLEADVAKLDAAADTVVFAPSVDEMYTHGPSSTRVTAGPVGDLFEGATRPGHFDGTLTVVAKLFNIVQPDVAVFGQKDAQQAFLVRQMVADLDVPVRLEIAPTVREADGLALSSRNRYLTEAEASAALALSGALAAAVEASSGGAEAARVAGRAVLEAETLVELDYLEVIDRETYRPVGDDFAGDALVIVAARLGTTRLIDNRSIALPPR